MIRMILMSVQDPQDLTAAGVFRVLLNQILMQSLKRSLRSLDSLQPVERLPCLNSLLTQQNRMPLYRLYLDQ